MIRAPNLQNKLLRFFRGGRETGHNAVSWILSYFGVEFAFKTFPNDKLLPLSRVKWIQTIGKSQKNVIVSRSIACTFGSPWLSWGYQLGSFHWNQEKSSTVSFMFLYFCFRSSNEDPFTARYLEFLQNAHQKAIHLLNDD